MGTSEWQLPFVKQEHWRANLQPSLPLSHQNISYIAYSRVILFLLASQKSFPWSLNGFSFSVHSGAVEVVLLPVQADHRCVTYSLHVTMHAMYYNMYVCLNNSLSLLLHSCFYTVCAVGMMKYFVLFFYCFCVKQLGPQSSMKDLLGFILA